LRNPIPGVCFTHNTPKLSHIFHGLEEAHADLGITLRGKQVLDARTLARRLGMTTGRRRRRGQQKGRFCHTVCMLLASTSASL